MEKNNTQLLFNYLNNFTVILYFYAIVTTLAEVKHWEDLLLLSMYKK